MDETALNAVQCCTCGSDARKNAALCNDDEFSPAVMSECRTYYAAEPAILVPTQSH